MYEQELRQRLDALFADIDRLAADPASSSPSIRQEMDELRARVCELEAQIAKYERPTCEMGAILPSEIKEASQTVEVEETPRRSMPILYEKEWVGYAFADEAVKPLQDPAEVTEGVAVPLLASGQPIGKLQIQPPAERVLTDEETGLLHLVAHQASLQIENLRLLDATERARAEAEAATHRFLHDSWNSFLDAIHQSELIGYAYDQSSVTPLLAPLQVNGGVQEVVKVMDEHIGMLYLEPDPALTLTNEDKALVASIANQVAQQVENIRLLADASRARAEAEEATRRLTREGWQSYTGTQDESGLGFIYDTNRVKRLEDAPRAQELSFVQPLKVRGEIIGQLAVAGDKEFSQEDADLTTAIATQVSVQLEAMRLTEELQRRAYELATVATVSTTASTLRDPDQLLQSVVDLTKERFDLYHAHIYLLDESGENLLLAAGAGETGRKMVEDGWSIPCDHELSMAARAARTGKSVVENDVFHDKNSIHLSNRLLPDTRSEMAIPIIVGDKVLGVFDVQSDIPNRFTEEDANIYITLTSQVGVALQNARLYVEQAATVAQLRELDRLKSSFLANMSHELRTPLNSILGFTDVMLEGLDGELTDYMDNDLRLVQKNGQHLLHLINDVLDMAKIESGRMNLHPEKFKVQSLLEEVTSITSTLASEKNVALFIDENSDHAIEVYADNTRLRQVMINLVNNSIKFTEKGKVSICAKPLDGARILISVKDTGIGIPPDKLEAVFQEFTQVDSSTTRKVGGTGLGLPISRRLVEMHGGRLWAESTGVEGEGSTFLVELPLEARITDIVEKKEK
ncbi:MAG TPA: ATP-binding protein [Anaerolineales bacterium]|nr:ATP-binding protein [Anaerolineales bacterium]